MTLLELYSPDNKQSDKAKLVREQTHWFIANCVFDPRTGEALPQSLSNFLAKAADDSVVNDKILKDRLWRITEHVRDSLGRLFRNLNESPRREQAVLPIHAVRELDANSFIKLSNRPGRTIREKLAGKPYMQAVRRYMSVDLPENQLLKAFARRLEELLELRRDSLGMEDELLPIIQYWLRSDEAQAISDWRNLPPNNTLLSHRDYRRILDAWRWLQTLDEDIKRDFEQFEERDKKLQRWQKMVLMWSSGVFNFADMPLFFKYNANELAISQWTQNLPLVENVKSRSARNKKNLEVMQGVCIDLACVYPRYSVVSSNPLMRTLDTSFIWQQWQQDGKETVEIELFDSDAVYFHPDAETVSFAELFFDKQEKSDKHEKAARAFASKLHETFKHKQLVWLEPDVLDVFRLETIRRNLNARFSNAEPLPRSVAAVFERINYATIKKDGYKVVVADSLGGVLCATKLMARYSSELNDCLQETHGFYWEKSPTVPIRDNDFKPCDSIKHSVATVDGDKTWHAPVPKTKIEVDEYALRNNKHIGEFDQLIVLSDSPVVGGSRLHYLQQRAKNIPLWRNQIPELAIKVIKDGHRQRFELVSTDTIIEPIRGKPVKIPISESFELPAGRNLYQFPLYIGGDDNDLGFSAQLKSPAFPLSDNTVCDLELTFEYGANEPYKLKFIPRDNFLPLINATWQPTKEVVINNAPAPEYPKSNINSWLDLQSWVDGQGNKIDLLEWLIKSLHRLNELIPIRSSVILSSTWKQKKDNSGNGYWFAFATTEEGNSCYCSTRSFSSKLDGDPNNAFPLGMRLFCDLRETQGGLSAFNIAVESKMQISSESKQRIISFKERSLKNRMTLIWGGGRSLDDQACPAKFKKEFIHLVGFILEKLPKDIIEKKMSPLFSCMHKDASDECVQWLLNQVEVKRIRNHQSIGVALGDVSTKWQQDVFQKLTVSLTNDALRIFAYAIWRERSFIERFSVNDLDVILNILAVMLGNIKPCPPLKGEKDKWTVRNWNSYTVEPLELLLGLLRTRDSNDPDIKMLLQPHQKITKELAKQVERITEITVGSGINLYSRVKITLEKPDSIRTPDLLYALDLYLTGHDGANAIYISGVSDDDND